MENRNQYNSPRDRIDDALLIRLLSEDEELPGYTCTGERRNGANSCGNSRNPRRNIREHREDPGCGNTRERQNTCGCGRDQREPCGCGNEHEHHGSAREYHGNDRENCSRNALPGFPLAMVYMPDHDWDGLFDEEEALMHGTLFRPLEFPFYPGRCGGNCGCR